MRRNACARLCKLHFIIYNSRYSMSLIDWVMAAGIVASIIFSWICFFKLDQFMTTMQMTWQVINFLALFDLLLYFLDLFWLIVRYNLSFNFHNLPDYIHWFSFDWLFVRKTHVRFHNNGCPKNYTFDSEFELICIHFITFIDYSNSILQSIAMCGSAFAP